MTILQDQERWVFSSGILRLVGYGLLVMTLINVLFLLIPLHLMNPLWEFQTMGAIVDRIPVALLGMVLVYYGEKGDRNPTETIILKGLSSFSLVAAMLLLLMIPLNISSSVQVYNQQNFPTNSQVINQENTIQQFQDQVKAANSRSEIGAILQQQGQQKVSIPDSVNIKKLKNDILTNLQNSQDKIISQAQSFRVQKRSLLFKKCLKSNIGALIASILFLLIWKGN